MKLDDRVSLKSDQAVKGTVGPNSTHRLVYVTWDDGIDSGYTHRSGLMKIEEENGLPNLAWAAIIEDNGVYSLGVAERGIKGYSPLNEWNRVTFPTYDKASEEAEARNEALGLSKTEAFKIVASTMKF